MRENAKPEKPKALVEAEKRAEKKRKDYQAKIREKEAKIEKQIAQAFEKHCEDAYCYFGEVIKKSLTFCFRADGAKNSKNK